MKRPGHCAAAALGLLVAATLGACQTYSKCGFRGCPGDAALTESVQAQFQKYPPLSAHSIRVQTLDKVVYLTGQVDTDVERLFAVSVAGSVDGVAHVVDSISVNNIGR